jgi:hypothetical protein
MEIELALSSGEVKEFVLKESVELKLCTLDQRWSSKSILAVIAPGLCTSIILGQSFLVSHSIVIDYAA